MKKKLIGLFIFIFIIVLIFVWLFMNNSRVIDFEEPIDIAFNPSRDIVFGECSFEEDESMGDIYMSTYEYDDKVIQFGTVKTNSCGNVVSVVTPKRNYYWEFDEERLNIKSPVIIDIKYDDGKYTFVIKAQGNDSYDSGGDVIYKVIISEHGSIEDIYSYECDFGDVNLYNFKNKYYMLNEFSYSNENKNDNQIRLSFKELGEKFEVTEHIIIEDAVDPLNIFYIVDEKSGNLEIYFDYYESDKKYIINDNFKIIKEEEISNSEYINSTVTKANIYEYSLENKSKEYEARKESTYVLDGANINVKSICNNPEPVYEDYIGSGFMKSYEYDGKQFELGNEMTECGYAAKLIIDDDVYYWAPTGAYDSISPMILEITSDEEGYDILLELAYYSTSYIKVKLNYDLELIDFHTMKIPFIPPAGMEIFPMLLKIDDAYYYTRECNYNSSSYGFEYSYEIRKLDSNLNVDKSIYIADYFIEWKDGPLNVECHLVYNEESGNFEVYTMEDNEYYEKKIVTKDLEEVDSLEITKEEFDRNKDKNVVDQGYAIELLEIDS